MLSLLLISAAFASQAQMGLGEITGTVIQKGTKEPIYDLRVFLMDGDKRYNARTTIEGRFRISAVPSGKYFIYLLKDGDTLRTPEPFYIPVDDIVQVGALEYSNTYTELKPLVATANRLRLTGGFLPIKKLTSEEIKTSPVKFDIKSLTASLTTDVKLMEDGSLVFRGARKGDMIYMVDGIKVTGELNLPSVAIGSMFVYSGGLPASYGDTMGGVVVIESKSYFDLLRDYDSAQLKAEAGY